MRKNIILPRGTQSVSLSTLDKLLVPDSRRSLWGVGGGEAAAADSEHSSTSHVIVIDEMKNKKRSERTSDGDSLKLIRSRVPAALLAACAGDIGDRKALVED